MARQKIESKATALEKSLQLLGVIFLNLETHHDEIIVALVETGNSIIADFIHSNGG